MSTDKTAPKIIFPCPNYPIKVIGESNPAMVSTVVNVFMEHIPNFAGLEGVYN